MRIDLRDRFPDDTEGVADVSDIDLQHELHPLQVLHKCSRGSRLSDDPRGGAVVDEVQFELDVPMGTQDQRQGRPIELLEVLCRQAMQPRTAIGAGDGDDRQM